MTKKIYRIVYLGYGSRVLESTLVEWRPGGRVRKLRSHIMNCKHEAESKYWGWGVSSGVSKANSSDVRLPVWPHFLNLPKQHHQLETTY